MPSNTCKVFRLLWSLLLCDLNKKYKASRIFSKTQHGNSSSSAQLFYTYRHTERETREEGFNIGPAGLQTVLKQSTSIKFPEAHSNFWMFQLSSQLLTKYKELMVGLKKKRFSLLFGVSAPECNSNADYSGRVI